MGRSAIPVNFAFTEFYEVRILRLLGSSGRSTVCPEAVGQPQPYSCGFCRSIQQVHSEFIADSSLAAKLSIKSNPLGVTTTMKGAHNCGPRSPRFKWRTSPEKRYA